MRPNMKRTTWPKKMIGLKKMTVIKKTAGNEPDFMGLLRFLRPYSAPEMLLGATEIVLAPA